MRNKRDSKIVNGFLNEGFEFKGVHYKPLSARTLLLLEKAKSPFYFGGDQLRGLLDWLFISSNESSVILNAIRDDEYDSLIMDFAETFSTEDIETLGELMNESNEDAASAIVDIKESKDTAKKK
jgi:hypothetical protein